MQLTEAQKRTIGVAMDHARIAVCDGEVDKRDAIELIEAIAKALRSSAHYLADDNGIVPTDEIRDLRERAERLDDLVWEVQR